VSLRLIAAPQVEPLLPADDVVRQHLRVIDSSEDAWISIALTKAREQAEVVCRRALISQQWLMTLDKFPSPGASTSSANWYGPSWGTGPGPLTTTRPDGISQYEIFVPRPPLVSVDSIKYYDDGGILQTLDPAAYIVDLNSEPGRIVPAVATSWPSTQNRVNAVEVHFTCGYGASGTSVPAGIKMWMLMMAGTLFENRELIAVLNRGQIKELPIFDGLLDDYRVQTYDVPAYWA
jgi:hypothetical protein